VYAENLMEKFNKDNKFEKYAYDVLQCTKKNRSNPFKYFALSNNPPTEVYACIVRSYDDVIRTEAINVIRKAYLSMSVTWCRKYLGLAQDYDIVQEINRLEQGDCVKSFDQSRQLIYFLKKKIH
jgi:hypothetical protein